LNESQEIDRISQELGIRLDRTAPDIAARIQAGQAARNTAVSAGKVNSREKRVLESLSTEIIDQMISIEPALNQLVIQKNPLLAKSLFACRYEACDPVTLRANDIQLVRTYSLIMAPIQADLATALGNITDQKVTLYAKLAAWEQNWGILEMEVLV